MNLTTLEDTIYAWLYDITGETVIFADGKGDRPALPFATIKLTSIIGVGREDIQPPDNMGDRLSHAMHEINVSLQFFGNSAGTNATKTRLMCQRETGTALLEAAGLHYFRDNGVANLTELNKTEFEARYGLEITLGYMDSGAENVDVIETVNVMGTGLGGVNPLDIATN